MPHGRELAAALLGAGWDGPLTEADVDRAVRSLRRSKRDPFAGRRWSDRGGSYVSSWVLVCDGGTLTDEAVAALDADDSHGAPDLLAHGVVGQAIGFSDRSGLVGFDVAPGVGPPDVIRLDAEMDDEAEAYPDVALCGWFEVPSGLVTIVDWAAITDRDQWRTFEVPPGSRVEIHMPSTDGISVRWGYVSLAEPEALITRISCELTTGMLPSPHFSVEFDADGSARWHGEHCVAPLGDDQANVGRASVPPPRPPRRRRGDRRSGILTLGSSRASRS